MDYNNVAAIYQPHFMTDCFRVACKLQKGDEDNYILVCCSPTMNGLYIYPADLTGDFTLWANGSTICYCVPITCCKKVCELNALTDASMIAAVKKL